jgi:glutamate/tyrosine decarboxylase-like PLP-dependent enzyme
MPSGRFYGFVIGGTHPAALAADWLTSAWDQNSGLRIPTPAHAAVEEVAATWLLDLLGLPAESAVGFATGATMSSFTCLAAALRAAMGMHGDYLIQSEQGDPFDTVPEVSRRGRAFAVWAVLHALGRSGVADLVDGFCRHATAFAEGVTAIGGEVQNDVVFTQMCAGFGSDERTRAVVQGMLADGTAWMTGSRWHGKDVLRISMSNWSTTDDDVRRSLDALRRVVATL